ncbi:hypothetical protein [Paenibacillus wynnii]|uniref:hypothetical protein n=1 Tax=Paenibacillus wynnii TaxID=268407 RepID=UPI00068E2650|nr:hypothetical protein [Paenibacillus wynnii]
MLICSLALVSCDAITAQKITNTGSSSFQGMNGGGRNGAPGMGNSMRGMMNADLTGKVLSVSGNTVTVEIVEQSKSKDNNNNQIQGGFAGGDMEWSDTGEQ